MQSTNSRVAVCAASLVWATAAFAQQNTFQPAALPNAAKPTVVNVDVVPTLQEAQLFRGVDLTSVQREAMLSNIGNAKIEWVQKSKLTPQDIAAQRVPSADGNMVLMQQFRPPPGALVTTDPCDTPGISDPDVAGLKRLLSLQLRAVGQDPTGLDQPELEQCRRKRLSFYLKVADRLAGSASNGSKP